MPHLSIARDYAQRLADQCGEPTIVIATTVEGRLDVKTWSEATEAERKAIVAMQIPAPERIRR